MIESWNRELNSFYSDAELASLGIKSYGENVFISRKSSIYDSQNITIGKNVRIDDFCILSGSIIIGSYVHIAAGTYLYGGNAGIVIDDFANISSRVCIYAISDDYSGRTMTNPMIPEKYKAVEQWQTHIAKHVIIGSGTTILPGSILNEGVAIGAMSFVKGELNAWGIYAGVPVCKIRERERCILQLEAEFLSNNR